MTFLTLNIKRGIVFDHRVYSLLSRFHFSFWQSYNALNIIISRKMTEKRKEKTVITIMRECIDF